MSDRDICHATTASGDRCSNPVKVDDACWIPSHQEQVWEGNGARERAVQAKQEHLEQLNDKQARFVNEYLVDLNATQAAIRAGYSENSAGQLGHALLKNVEVAAAVQEAMNRRAERTQITADRVLYELSRIAYANMAEYVEVQRDGSAVVDLSELTPDQAAAIQEITSDVYMEGRGDDAVPVKKVKLKLHARSRPLELLGKHLGIWKDRLEHSGPDGAPLRFTMDIGNAGNRD